MITYQVESFIGIKAETAPLFFDHWREIATHQDEIKLDPDYAVYDFLEKSGRLSTVTVRDEGELIGYHVSIVMPHLHYKSSLTAQTDIYYIKPERRKGMIAARMFKFAEATLKEMGVQRIYTGCKVSNDIGRLLERLGHTEIERHYSKLI